MPWQKSGDCVSQVSNVRAARVAVGLPREVDITHKLFQPSGSKHVKEQQTQNFPTAEPFTTPRGTMTYTSIRPGQVWLDTEGNPIHAHGGSIFHHEDTYFWYGENKEKSTPGSNIWHWGVRCYRSMDLYNWKDCGLIIPPNLDDETSPLHPSQGMDRPHIIFNPSTKKYVCWLKIMHSGHTQQSTVLEADHILGPYRMVQSGLRPLGMNAGDFDLVVDPTDHKAYYYFERVHSELICADLTDDFTNIAGHYSTHFPQTHPPYVREAPAYFRRKHLHYLITSGTTWYYPNPSEVACAQTYHGPWTVLGNPHPADTTKTSYHSQVSSVFKHPHKKDLYIALADRWLPSWTQPYEEVKEEFCRVYGGEEEHKLDLLDPDTSKATYIWLPFRFEGNMAILDWHDEWRLDDFF
jgi:Glycosyl hydrolases family 43